MSVLIATQHSVWMGSQAWIVQNDLEMAWAERHYTQNSAFRHILGRYVMAEDLNSNGQSFHLEELRTAQSSLVHSPLNINHKRDKVYGAYVASDLVYPMGADSAGAIAEAIRAPYMEALAVFYHNLFPEEFRVVEKAHAEGALFFSMEALPRSVTCRADGCGQEFSWMGPKAPDYCEHLAESRVAPRWLNKPHFLGGALIVPPVRPGWRQADITDLSRIVQENALLAEQVYDSIAAEMPHLDPATWEQMMLQVLVAAVVDPKEMHNYTAGPDGGPAGAPCDICGKEVDAPIHGLPKAKPKAAAAEDDLPKV